MIYKEINLIDLNEFNKVTTNCFVLPDQKVEFVEVAIAFGKDVDWLIKKPIRDQLVFEQTDDEFLINQKTNRLINEKVWNLMGPQAKTNRNAKMNNLKKLSNIDHSNNSILNSLNEFSLDYNSKQQQDNYLIDNYLRSNYHSPKNSTVKSHKRPNKLGNFNTDSLQFAIEIIDSLSGKVFRSNHHSNDILQSINFQNFELQKLNNSMVYVQKNSKKDTQNSIKNTLNSLSPKLNSKRVKIKSNRLINRNQNANQTDQPILLRLFTQKGKQFLDQFEQYKGIDKHDKEITIVEKKIDNLFKINNNTISIRQYVLIKNLNPLRAFLYNEGLVFFMQNTTQFKPKTGYWLFSHLRNYFDKQYPNNSIYLNLVEVLSKFLLITEFHLISNFKFLERFQFFKHPDRFSDNQFNDNKMFKSKLNKDCLKQFELIEIELILTDKFEFYIVDVNQESTIFDNHQIPFRDFSRQSRKELNSFQKTLLNSVWQFIGLIKSSSSEGKNNRNNGGLVKQFSMKNLRSIKSFKNQKNLNNYKRHVRRNVSLKKIKDLPRKYLDQLQKQSSKVRRKLLFVNEMGHKHKLINNWHTNRFRKTLSRLLIEENIGVMGLNCLVSHKLCLTEIDLNNILLTNLEYKRNGNSKFDQLYPSSSMCNLNNIILELNNKLLSSYANLNPILHRTADLHPFLCKLETQISKTNDDEEENFNGNSNQSNTTGSNELSNTILQTNDDNFNLDKTKISKNEYFIDNILNESFLKKGESKDYYSINDLSSNDMDETIENLNYNNNQNRVDSNAKQLLNCSLDDDDLYSIGLLELEPKQNLTLKFNSKYQSQFKTKVNYDLILVNLIVNTKHCNGRIKLNQLISPSLNVSLNLGIGTNRIMFQVINDLDKFDRTKTYQLIIERLSLDDVSNYDQSSENQFICQINQVSFFIIALSIKMQLKINK